MNFGGAISTMKCRAAGVLLTLLMSAIIAVSAGAATLLGPIPYRGFGDSPFVGSFEWLKLETFESGILATPGVTVSTGVVVTAPGPFTDSVDADDGSIDGDGRSGRSMHSGGLRAIRFTFDKAQLGALPTHVGIVVTDVGISDRGFGSGRFLFDVARDVGLPGGASGGYGYGSSFAAPSRASLFPGRAPDATLIDPRTGLPVVGDPFAEVVVIGEGSISGEAAEDRFYGVIDPRGIEAVDIFSVDSSDWEVDHLQFGFSALLAATSEVAEPMSLLGLASAVGIAVAVGRLRRRRETM